LRRPHERYDVGKRRGVSVKLIVTAQAKRSGQRTETPSSSPLLMAARAKPHHSCESDMAVHAQRSLQGLRVLLVEDEALILLMTEGMLQEIGCRLFGAASTLGEAMSMVQEDLPDVAVLDVNLRGEMSFAFAELLHRRNVPVLFLTGYDAPGAEQIWGRFPKLQKPCDASDLKQALLHLLDKSDKGSSIR